MPTPTATTAAPLRVTVWHEYLHEKTNPAVAAIYPQGIHHAIKSAIESHLGPNITVNTALLEQPSHGLTPDILNQTDVLTWWGHAAHHKVSDDIVNAVHQRVLQGMGLVALHSAHFSKIFIKLI